MALAWVEGCTVLRGLPCVGDDLRKTRVVVVVRDGEQQQPRGVYLVVLDLEDSGGSRSSFVGSSIEYVFLWVLSLHRCLAVIKQLGKSNYRPALTLEQLGRSSGEV